jgi:nitroreductase
MITTLKNTLAFVLPKFAYDLFIKFGKYLLLLLNFATDFIEYSLYSSLFVTNNFSKLEALVTIEYHRIEKGFLFPNRKYRFGIQSIIKLNEFLSRGVITNNGTTSQIIVAYKILCKYYEIHQENNISIKDYFPNERYLYYLSFIEKGYSKSFKETIDVDKNDFYKRAKLDFFHFANSRKSIRSFTQQLVDDNRIRKAIELAATSPSVCNRQASKVYYINEKVKIMDILKIQGGFNGFSQDVSQLLILTTNRNAFYSVGERNQHYIDGGIFLMNLLYALHFYEIANCPANWAKTYKEEKQIRRFVQIPKSEKVICLIPIGIAPNNFRICRSERKNIQEILVTNKKL